MIKHTPEQVNKLKGLGYSHLIFYEKCSDRSPDCSFSTEVIPVSKDNLGFTKFLLLNNSLVRSDFIVVEL